MDALLIDLLNALGTGLLLFMLSAGLTLVFSMMGVLNFAHASFYMLGAYLGLSIAGHAGFWAALLLAPLVAGLSGMAFERLCLRRVRTQGHAAEMLATFGLAVVMLEAVQLVWGTGPLNFDAPALLHGPAFTLVQGAGGLQWVGGSAPASLCAASGVSCSNFPLTRVFAMVLAVAMLLALRLLLKHTRTGLVLQAALLRPRMVEALGHDVPAIFAAVFGAGCALAALAGVVGGISFGIEPAMATQVGSIIFVIVVVGGLGSLRGAFVASLLVGLLQTLPLRVDASLVDLARRWGHAVGPDHPAYPLLKISLAQSAALLPYLLMVVVLALRPRGLFGRREG